MYVCMHACTCVYIDLFTCSICVCVCAYVYVSVHVHVHVHVYVYVYVYIHMCEQMLVLMFSDYGVLLRVITV